MRLFLIVPALAILGLNLYIRYAPAEPARYHVAPGLDMPDDAPEEGGFGVARRITSTPEAVLRSVQTIAEATPRTRLVAGSVAGGMMTFETRSRVMGFPDYTTVAVSSDGGEHLLQMHGRLRFGRRDMGVNRARIRDWLAQLGPQVVPLS